MSSIPSPPTASPKSFSSLPRLPHRRLEPNLTATGRLLRALTSSLLLAGGALLVPQHGVVGLALLAAGGFVLFEAWRGWCVLRACGVRTRW